MTVAANTPIELIKGGFAPTLDSRVGAARQRFGRVHLARFRAHASATPVLTGPRTGAWRRTWALGDRSRRHPPPANAKAGPPASEATC